MDEKTASKFGPALFFLLLTIGRLLGGAVLTIMSARTCFRLSALLGLVGAGAIMIGSPALALAGVFAAGLGFANIWPMLFSITVEEKPECANELSGLMCMAISGGAMVPLLMSKLVGPTQSRWPSSSPPPASPTSSCSRSKAAASRHAPRPAAIEAANAWQRLNRITFHVSRFTFHVHQSSTPYEHPPPTNASS